MCLEEQNLGQQMLKGFSLLTPCKVIWITKFRKILILEPEILGFGIRNSAQEIRNPDSNYPESKTVLDYLTLNDTSLNCVSLGEKAPWFIWSLDLLPRIVVGLNFLSEVQ